MIKHNNQSDINFCGENKLNMLLQNETIEFYNHYDLTKPCNDIDGDNYNNRVMIRNNDVQTKTIENQIIENHQNILPKMANANSNSNPNSNSNMNPNSNMNLNSNMNPNSRPGSNKNSPKIDPLDMDDVIDMTEYTRDTRWLILTEDDMKIIVGDFKSRDNLRSNETLQQKYLAMAFSCIKRNDLMEFRKTLYCCKYIVNHKYNKTFLIHEACRLNAPDFVGVLLFMNVNCNVIDDCGFMPQHYAARCKSTVIIDILAIFGHDINVKDSNGDTPLHHAVMTQNEDMIKVLLEYKADKNIKNNLNEKPKDKCLMNDKLLKYFK